MMWYVGFSKYHACNLPAFVKASSPSFLARSKLSKYLRPESAPAPLVVIKVSVTTN